MKKKTPFLFTLVNNTDSSAEGMDLCGGADRSCLSAIGGEVGDDSSSISSRSSKLRLAGCWTPRFRINSSPGLDRKKYDVAPKPPQLALAQVQMEVKVCCICFVLSLPGRKWISFIMMSLFYDNM